LPLFVDLALDLELDLAELRAPSAYIYAEHKGEQTNLFLVAAELLLLETDGLVRELLREDLRIPNSSSGDQHMRQRKNRYRNTHRISECTLRESFSVR
jgi:hypothetical protein